MNKKDYAVSLFNKGFNCSQAVLSAFADECGLNSKSALKIACGFGGGMRKGEVCGAVTGALMVIGLKYGQFIESDIKAKQNTYSLVTEFQRNFTDRNKSVICKELLGYDLSIASEYEKINQIGLFKIQCPKYIEDSIEILEKLITKEEKNYEHSI